LCWLQLRTLLIQYFELGSHASNTCWIVSDPVLPNWK
jgi:hypothetical protein